MPTESASVFLIDPKKSILTKLNKNICNKCNYNELNTAEWGYLFEYKKYKLFIPCESIYKYFYANDKTLNNIISKGSPFEYYFDYKIQNNIVEIHQNKRFSKYYTIHFSKIYSNKVYLNGFFYHFFQKYIKKSKNGIISIIPTFEKFRINTNYKELKNNFLLITEIHEDDIKYPFNTIFCYQHSSDKVIKHKIELKEKFVSNLYNNFYINISRKINNDQDLKIIKIHTIKIFIKNQELNIEPFNIIDDISFIVYILNFSETSPYNPVCIITIDYPNIKNNIWLLKGFTVDNLYKPGIFIDDLNPIIKYFYDKNKSIKKLKNHIKQTYNYDFYSLSISNLYLREEETYKKYKEIKKLLLKIKKEFT